MKGKKVVVTGGLGFIGSNMVDRLVGDNEVLVIDDGSTGRLENIRHIKSRYLKVLEGSIVDLDLKRAFHGYDYVFHLAARPSVPRSIADPEGSNNANITGTLKVLTAAKDAGIKKVVFASSSSVYGNTPTLPKREDMPVNPMSPYAVTKAAGEMYCRVFNEIYGLPTVSLRYFNVFGPNQDPGSQYAAVVPRFISAIMRDEVPMVYGDGEQSRDFTFVRHVVDANILACESDQTGVFNVACNRRITVNQLVGMINDAMGKDIRPRYLDPRPGDIKHSQADITKARAFGYSPDSDLRDELAVTIGRFETCGHIA